MIHVAIGTKAQFIKMMPIMLTLQQRGIDFNLIDIGQHALITQNLRSEFGLKQPDVSLSAGENVARLGQGLRWILRLGILGMNRDWINSTVFHHRKGVCLIHGDTVSTLIGLCLLDAPASRWRMSRLAYAPSTSSNRSRRNWSGCWRCASRTSCTRLPHGRGTTW